MSLNTKSVLSQSKKQALSSILSNIDIKFPYIKTDIQNTLKNNDGSFSSLMSMYFFRGDIVSSSQISAVYLLSYLDFFALYIILSANYNTFANLHSAALNKYLYIFSLYRDSFSLIKEKTLAKENSFIQYNTFLSPSYIDMTKSQAMVYEKNTNDVLNTNDALTLPIFKSKTITPRSITVTDNDISVHETLNLSTQSQIDYSVERKQFPKMGVADLVTPAKKAVSYSMIPEISGTVFGFVGEKIYFKVSAINGDQVSLKGSSDGVVWSNEYTTTIGENASIKIEDNNDSGLKVKLYSGNGLAINDVWKVDIRMIHIPDPDIISKVDFSLMEQVSYIKFDDVSKYKISINSIESRDIKYNDFNSLEWFSDDLSYVVPVHSKIDTLKIDTTQTESSLSSVDGFATYAFGCKLYNIKAVLNDYMSSGSIAFSPITLEAVNKARLQMLYSIKGEQQYPHGGTITQNMFIENSIMVQDNLNKIEIPVLIENHSGDILEYVVPVDVTDGDIARIRLRLPVDIASGIKIYNMSDNTVINVDTNIDVIAINENFAYVILHNYASNINYFIEYKIKEYSFEDIIDSSLITNTKWNIESNICFMHFKDMEGKSCVAIRKVDGTDAIQFDGICFLSTTMKSIDLPYISPIVYDYTLIFN